MDTYIDQGRHVSIPVMEYTSIGSGATHAANAFKSYLSGRKAGWPINYTTAKAALVAAHGCAYRKETKTCGPDINCMLSD